MTQTWKEKLTWEQKLQVEKELKQFGLDDHQIRSLMNYRGRVSELELNLMRDMPPNRWGKRATIGAVQAAIASCKTLGLLKVKK